MWPLTKDWIPSVSPSVLYAQDICIYAQETEKNPVWLPVDGGFDDEASGKPILGRVLSTLTCNPIWMKAWSPGEVF